MIECDVCVIGGGPGGLIAAATLAIRGRKVVVANAGPLMGYGIEGAFKSKSEFEITRHYLQSRFRPEVFGNSSPPAWHSVRAGIERSARGLNVSLQDRIRRLGVTLISGHATFENRNTILVNDERVRAAQVIIATGTLPRLLPGIDVDGHHVVTSDEIMGIDALPESLVVLGGGVIGCEFAGMFAALGSQVKLIDTQDRILASEDQDISDFLSKAMVRNGVEVMSSCRFKSLKVLDSVVHTRLANDDTLESEVILLAVGRTPCTQDLGLEHVGVDVDDRGYVPTNHQMQTNVSNIYAVGDVGLRNTPVDMALVHVAQAEGRCSAYHILGEDFNQSMDHIPYIIFSLPMVAGAGLAESLAGEKYGKVRVGKYPFGRNHRAHAMGSPFGFVKLIVGPDGDDRMLGIRAIGRDVDSLISAASIMIEQQLPYTYLINSIMPHPSLMECLQGAANIISGDALAFEEHEEFPAEGYLPSVGSK